MKKLMVISICLLSLLGCGKKAPAICTDGLAKVEKMLDAINKSAQINDRDKKEVTDQLKFAIDTFKETISKDSFSSEDKKNVCTYLNDDINRADSKLKSQGYL